MPTPAHGESEAEHRVLQGLRFALLASIAVLLLEGAGAYLSRSLSVTLDAVHNIPDIIAFAVSFAVLKATEGGADERYTFGAHRLEVFAGLLNGVIVLATGIGFGFTALTDLFRGPAPAGSVDGLWVLAIALPTLALRGSNLVALRRIPNRARDLNFSSVVLHLASDLLITAALLFAGAILFLRPSATWVDPSAAVMIAGVLIYECLPLFRDAWEVLTEATPRNLSIEAITRATLETPRVADVHDIHVWAVCPTLVCMTAHVRVEEMSVRDGMDVVKALRDRMEKEFGILHSVFQVEVSERPSASGT